MNSRYETELSTSPDHQDNTESLDSNYGPEDLENIDRAVAVAIGIIQEAMRGDRRMDTSETGRGLRGFVDANVPGGNIKGFFEGISLDLVTISLEGDDGKEHPLTINKPESNTPTIYLDGQSASGEALPSVVSVLEQIKAELKERNVGDEDGNDASDQLPINKQQDVSSEYDPTP